MEKEPTIKQKVPAFIQNSSQRFALYVANYPRILKRTSLKARLHRHRYRNFNYNVNRAAIVR